MTNFIEITDSNGDKRLINTNMITDIIGSKIYLNCGTVGEQTHINCKESYEEIRHMICR